jgi:hypothetical protein
MRLVVFADSTCNVYPGGNTLKQWMWDRNWVRYDQKGGAGFYLNGLTKELRDYLTKTHQIYVDGRNHVRCGYLEWK